MVKVLAGMLGALPNVGDLRECEIQLVPGPCAQRGRRSLWYQSTGDSAAESGTALG